MGEIVIGNGTCLGFGGTNARVGQMVDGDLARFDSISTPDNLTDFAAWMARQTLKASDRGDEWVVAGFPGLVSVDGTTVGPMANVDCFKTGQAHLLHEMVEADSAVGKIFEEGFRLINVNDGELAAQAVAYRLTRDHPDYRKVSALIVGTGVGAGTVIRDKKSPVLWRPDRSCPVEIGHLFFEGGPRDSFENTISGPALAAKFGPKSNQLKPEHGAARMVGRRVGQLIMTLGLMMGSDLVVPTGGIGAGASDAYGDYMWQLLDEVVKDGKEAQRKLKPKVVTIPPSEAQTFELFGSFGVMRDFLTQSAEV